MTISRTPTPRPFRLNGAFKTPLPGPLNALIETAAEHLTGLSRLGRLYHTLPASTTASEFVQDVLDLFDIRYSVGGARTAPLPASGPVVVVANHPFGGLEGVILAHYLLRHRPDVKFMANYVLGRIPEVAELFIAVDPFGGAASRTTNVVPLRESLRWLKSGGVLVIFPAGEVSHLHAREGRVTDPAWSPSVARLIRSAGATVVPMFFHGSNSLVFQILGLVNARIRTALLPRELLNKGSRHVRITVGAPLMPKQLAQFDDDEPLIRYLRLRTYSLASSPNVPRSRDVAQTPEEPIIDPVPGSIIRAEIEALPACRKLAESGSLAVWYASAGEIPNTLQDIGRLRELTFRRVGEGTGRRSDIDLFDAYYLQLVLWDNAAQRVAGAYRLGLVDDILRKYGKHGLYTQRLFRYRDSLLRRLPPAIELGRSFVAPDYQKSYGPLLLLWKGIGAFLSNHPGYRVLFGPVSISADYTTWSQQLLVDFLRVNRFDDILARGVKPRNAFRQLLRKEWGRSDLAAVNDVDRLSDVIAQIEPDGKGVPVLLRQYLRLGGRLLGFNVDPQFSNALDGLIMVDLIDTDPAVLRKYMGAQQSENYLAFHRANTPTWRKAS